MARLKSTRADDHAGPVLEMRGVVKRFGRNVVLRGLDLSVGSHEEIGRAHV